MFRLEQKRNKTKNKKGIPLYKQKHKDGVAGIQPLALASSVAWKQTFCSQLCCFVSLNFFT